MKFRKKPVEVEAITVREAIHCAARDWKGLPKWLVSAYDIGDAVFLPYSIEIRTLEGRMVGSEDDWIIRGVQGELYPCKPDIFKATYEQVGE